MKLRFEPDLDFQRQAIEAVCGLFRGQEICRTEFTVAPTAQASLALPGSAESELGVGNRLTLPDDRILANLNDIQLRNGLPPSPGLDSGNFTVEMETGTGKTYVYLRTILELNKRFGFTKFVVVVPSVAIKEGVYKSLQITREHFRSLYSGAPCEYFLYDSAKLGQVRNFAASASVQIMVVTVGAINKKAVNNLYKDSEKTGGDKPIDLIRATRPIVIVDEPQSVDGGLRGQGRKALAEMNPLCTLRYSATHVDKHHMVYRLDAVDAYQRKLVKQIEVAAATVENAHNRPYLRLISTRNRRGVISASVELDVEGAAGRVNRAQRTVIDGDDLEYLTDRAVYRGYRIGEIRVGGGNAFIELRTPGGERYLREGEAFGDVDAGAVARHMIWRTIREHLEKEQRLRRQGIKVLSLFFVDSVASYRRYDDAGIAQKGNFARAFEEEYRRLANHPDFTAVFEEPGVSSNPEEVHEGYFSIDKKGSWTNTAESNQAGRENAERAYNLIMRDKERLLNLDEPLRFIFSHSALREGWDNPNVFQICALRDMQSELQRRQTIGRGLRLCVNQQGERLRGFDVNTLTVVARESYEEFAENLQREIEEDTGFRFGVVAPHQFAQMTAADGDGQTKILGFDQSRVLYEHLRGAGYVNSQGRIQNSLREALRDESVVLPTEFAAHQAAIVAILRKAAGRLEIRNADERQTVRTRQAVLDSAGFKALWDRIKHKTTYRVDFDNEALLQECAKTLRDDLSIPATRLQWRKADVGIGKAGVEATEKTGSQTIRLREDAIELPDLLAGLESRTQLTRRSLARIVIDSGRSSDFKRNPQAFIEQAAQAINNCKRGALVDGVKYQRVGADAYYAQELFHQKEINGYLKQMLDAKKSIYDKVVYESETERRFAEDMEKSIQVKVYAKLPGWFKVPTPLGGYNPDWAVLVDADGSERLYFVVETKGSADQADLQSKEQWKITCGKKHFEALQVREPKVRYEVATRLDDLLARV